MITELDMNTPIPGSGFAPDENLNVVMFFGNTCGPCKATMPNFEEVAKFFTEKSSRVKFYKFHVWESAEQRAYVAETWGVQGVPHFKIFIRGEIIGDKTGGGDFNTLHKFVHDSIDEAHKRYNDRI